MNRTEPPTLPMAQLPFVRQRNTALRLIPALLATLLATPLQSQEPIRTSPEGAYQDLVDGNHESAIIAYEAMLSTEQERPDFHFNLGVAYFHTFRFQSALRAFDRAVQLSIENPDFQAKAEFNIGVALFEQSRLYATNDPVRTMDYLDQAIMAFENTVELDPENEAGLLNLSRCQHLKQALIAAQEAASSATSDSDDPESESQPTSDPSDNDESAPEARADASPDADRKAPQPGADPSNARMPKNPESSDQIPGKPGSARLDVNEALLLLDALEHTEKRITLSQLDPSADASETSGSGANW